MKYNLELIKNKRKIISFSTFLILLSLLGILYSTFNTSYKKPINLGMDFVGGNELRIERVCEAECSNFSPDSVLENLREISKNNKVLKTMLEHIAVHRTIDIRQESRGKVHLLGRVYRKILEPICYWVGKHD